MTQPMVRPRARIADRWPTALAVVAAVAAGSVIVLFDREADYFGPSIAVMAGIYLAAFAIGRPWTAWPAFVVLSAVVTALQFGYTHGTLSFDAPVGMALVLVVLWLWTLARRRYADARTFTVQTAGMVGFGALTLLCAAVEPRWGALLAGVGILGHAGWDAYHFAVDRVVNRPWSEFCGVLDVLVGAALIVAAVA